MEARRILKPLRRLPLAQGAAPEPKSSPALDGVLDDLENLVQEMSSALDELDAAVGKPVVEEGEMDSESLLMGNAGPKGPQPDDQDALAMLAELTAGLAKLEI